MNYTAQTGTTEQRVHANCNAHTSNRSVQTNVRGDSPGKFNGCWLTIAIPIPTDNTVAQQGWWKIQYNMTGNGTSNDVTTWKVSIRGNPVHLVVP